MSLLCPFYVPLCPHPKIHRTSMGIDWYEQLLMSLLCPLYVPLFPILKYIGCLWELIGRSICLFPFYVPPCPHPKMHRTTIEIDW